MDLQLSPVLKVEFNLETKELRGGLSESRASNSKSKQRFSFSGRTFFNDGSKYSVQERGGYCMSTSKAAVAPNPRTFRRSLLSLEVDHDSKSLAACIPGQGFFF